jgi:hypothetical protein
MSIGKLVSPLAIAAVLGFSSAAMAQTMIGGKAVPEDQLEAVNMKCTELTTASLTEPTEADEAEEAATPAEPESEQEEGEPADPADPNAIDLETLTADLCREAGLPTP